MIRDLAAGVDVMIETFRPGVAERMGFTDLSPINSRLVYAISYRVRKHRPLRKRS